MEKWIITTEVSVVKLIRRKGLLQQCPTNNIPTVHQYGIIAVYEEMTTRMKLVSFK